MKDNTPRFMERKSGRNIEVTCACGAEYSVKRNTIKVVCNKCGKVVEVELDNAQENDGGKA